MSIPVVTVDGVEVEAEIIGDFYPRDQFVLIPKYEFESKCFIQGVELDVKFNETPSIYNNYKLVYDDTICLKIRDSDELRSAIRSNRTEDVLEYIKFHESDKLCIADHYGQTPLHLAVVENDQAIIKALLDKLTDEDVAFVKYGCETSVLHYAAQFATRSTLELMLKYDSVKKILNLGDCDEMLPLHIAMKHSRFNAVELLLEAMKLKGVDIPDFNNDLFNDEYYGVNLVRNVQILFRYDDLVDKFMRNNVIGNDKMNRLLLHATYYSPYNTVKVLYDKYNEHGLKTDMVSMDDYNLLHLAVQRVDIDKSEKKKLIDLLLQDRYINAVDKYNQTPLFWSIEARDFETFKVLYNRTSEEYILKSTTVMSNILIFIATLKDAKQRDHFMSILLDKPDIVKKLLHLKTKDEIDIMKIIEEQFPAHIVNKIKGMKE